MICENENGRISNNSLNSIDIYLKPKRFKKGHALYISAVLLIPGLSLVNQSITII